eukprot:CAMPEP_0194749190 /NCGR_PEP_ID=MMETSP0323_2-20130528/3386_1 /TAXON_ID=2866 ORGANISM="Crypthecodinium cohnii, Strain Seligo" /NCGR_SAMPLE_ID=MMETSP0323_2 /ASSEMBLY_ACC=CAM_ASM_000346 /LENGTH=117 /DNA_ID=CAMNT_0039664097 /DNA_START=67 /DNA_END=420 /DNA_ORIENTATION=+
MFGLVRTSGAAAIRRAGATHFVAAPAVRAFSTGIKIMDEAGAAKENLYWHNEDEKLIRKMIENNPDLNPDLQGISGILKDDTHSVSDKVKLVFMKHGIPPVNKALISDIVDLVEHEK